MLHLCGIWSGSALFAYVPLLGFPTTMWVKPLANCSHHILQKVWGCLIQHSRKICQCTSTGHCQILWVNTKFTESISYNIIFSESKTKSWKQYQYCMINRKLRQKNFLDFHFIDKVFMTNEKSVNQPKLNMQRNSVFHSSYYCKVAQIMFIPMQSWALDVCA